MKCLQKQRVQIFFILRSFFYRSKQFKRNFMRGESLITMQEYNHRDLRFFLFLIFVGNKIVKHVRIKSKILYECDHIANEDVLI